MPSCFSATPVSAGALLTFALLVQPAAAGRPAIADFMVMTACADAADHVLPGVLPTDPACTTRRKLRPGEMAPYRLTDFAAATGPCANRQGVVARFNLPVRQGAALRVVSFDRHVPRRGCDLVGDGMPAGASIQGSDAEYGFILGDDAPAGQLSFDSPPGCRAAPHSAVRFTRGWVIGPAVLPPPRVPGSAAFRAVLTPGEPGLALDKSCPTGGALALTTWMLDEMVFTGGLALPAFISNHFSHANADGTGPGAAQQMERTYWTAEFGLSRWEKWARADWTGGGGAVGILARAAMSDATCGAPRPLPHSPAPALETGPLQSAGAWSQTLRDPGTGEQFTWLLVTCRDYTRLDRTPQAIPPIPSSYAGWWRN